MQIAIDGPGGAGKSTVARAIAERLGIVYVDTGALYRTIGLYVHSKGVGERDETSVEALLPEITLELKYENGRQIVLLNGEDHGDAIRTPLMALYASAVSAMPAVRAFLLETQRKIARENSVVMDGRDIGTVIMPNADVKIFLTASDECRATRRYEELRAKGDMTATYESVLEQMKKRDDDDRNRAIAPAVPAKDAVILDNSWFSVDQTVSAVLSLIEEKVGLMY